MNLKAMEYYFKAIIEWADVKIEVSVIGGVFLHLRGVPTAGVYAFIAIAVCDFILGISMSLWRGEFTRERFFRGIGKYMVFGIALMIARQTDIIIADVLDFMKHIDSHSILFQYRMLGYLAIHEALSVYGKLSSLGVQLPIGMLSKLNDYKEALEKREPEKTI